uniref:Uncharacterized protein n=1 Tax=Arundo donax TaxID=35708 RepID=A0A0A9HPN3_ARUDO
MRSIFFMKKIVFIGWDDECGPSVQPMYIIVQGQLSCTKMCM